ncbi:MAG: NAD(P)H-binding protein [Cyanobacteria bacterium]|nr:NAD(P)H-binding protein [Cyanobacteriota bacterium]
MNVVLFGATGLAGGGVLQACLAAPDVTEVRAFVRRTTGVSDPKLREVIHGDYLQYSLIANAFAGVEACFFCLGASVSQVPDEADYRRIHQRFPLAAAKMLREKSPGATFHYLSGGRAHVNSRWMWARVKGEAERDLMDQFDAPCYPPAMIDGEPAASQPRLTIVLRPLLRLIFKPFRGTYIMNTDIGRAMLEAQRQGLRRRTFENAEMRDLADRYRATS